MVSTDNKHRQKKDTNGSSFACIDIFKKIVKNLRFLDKSAKYSCSQANESFCNKSNDFLKQETQSGKDGQNYLRFVLSSLNIFCNLKTLYSYFKKTKSKKIIRSTIWNKLNDEKLNNDEEINNIINSTNEINDKQKEKWRKRALLRAKKIRVNKTIADWQNEIFVNNFVNNKDLFSNKDISSISKKVENKTKWEKILLLRLLGCNANNIIHNKQLFDNILIFKIKELLHNKNLLKYIANKQTISQQNSHEKNLLQQEKTKATTKSVNVILTTLASVMRYSSALAGALAFTIVFPFSPHTASTIYHSCSTSKNSARSTGEAFGILYEIWQVITINRRLNEYELFLEIAQNKLVTDQKSQNKSSHKNKSTTIDDIKTIIKKEKDKYQKHKLRLESKVKSTLFYTGLLVGVAFVYFASAAALIQAGTLIISTSLVINSIWDIAINIKEAISLQKKINEIIKNGTTDQAEISKKKKARSRAIYKACTNAVICATFTAGLLGTCAMFVPIPGVQIAGAFTMYATMGINAVLFPTFYCVEQGVYKKGKKKFTKKDTIKLTADVAVTAASTTLFAIGTAALFIPEPVVSKVVCGVCLGLGAALMGGWAGIKTFTKIATKIRNKLKSKRYKNNNHKNDAVVKDTQIVIRKKAVVKDTQTETLKYKKSSKGNSSEQKKQLNTTKLKTEINPTKSSTANLVQTGFFKEQVSICQPIDQPQPLTCIPKTPVPKPQTQS